MTTQMETLHIAPASLAKASLGALAAAGVILTLFVLPAETGFDPTGVGARLGLTDMAASGEEAPAAADKAMAGAVNVASIGKADIIRATPYRTDEKVIALAPHEGIEIKAHMAKGDTISFRWDAKGGPVKMDMHGEAPQPVEGEFTTYWKELDLTEAQGVFTASFDGRHGWYWRNKGDVPVTITLKTSGFYKDLFQPEE